MVWAELEEDTQAEAANTAILHDVISYLEAVFHHHSGNVFACEPGILLSRAVGRSGAMVGAGWCQQPALRGCNSDARPSLQLRIFLICKLKRPNFSGQ